jgi:hypothetical protein
MLGGQRPVIQPEPLHESRPEVLDHDIRGEREPAGGRSPFVAREVERHRAFVAVQREEVRGVPADERRAPSAGVVAGLGTLDLDHVRTEVGEQHGREGAGQHPGEVRHPDAREGQAGRDVLVGCHAAPWERAEKERRAGPKSAAPVVHQRSSVKSGAAFVTLCRWRTDAESDTMTS